MTGEALEGPFMFSQNQVFFFMGWLFVFGFLQSGSLRADPPAYSFIFPAGGQKGTNVKVRVGGLDLHRSCDWELLGPGLATTGKLTRTKTRWFEGPLLPLPDSQRVENYPQDMAGEIKIAKGAALGLYRGRLWTSEGAAAGLRFQVGEYPEIIEKEIEGDPVPLTVPTPVTINGRIFPRENIDVWVIHAKKGQTVTCEVFASRLGSPLDSHLQVLGPDDKEIAANDDAKGKDSLVHFTAPADGKYKVRIQDVTRNGGPDYVYRLTITTGPYVDHLFPLGGRRGTKSRFQLIGHGLTRQEAEISLPAMGNEPQTLSMNGIRTNPIDVDLGDIPEFQEKEPNDTPETANAVTAPGVLNGRIGKPGDVDTWSFKVQKGERFELRLQAQGLGSPLFGILQVGFSAGKPADSKTLAMVQATAQDPDPVLEITAPRNGSFYVTVSDRFKTRGGPAFGYRVKITKAIADFSLHFPAEAMTLVRGKPLVVRMTAKRKGGFNGAIDLEFPGLPAGIKATPTKMPASQSTLDVTLVAAPETAIGAVRILAHGKAEIDKAKVLRKTADNLLLAVSLTPPFKLVGGYDLRLAPRGTVFRKKFKIERNGFAGPLEVRLADRQARHLQGVTGPTLQIPATANEFEYPVRLPPWMETGRTARACIMATGTVREGGKDHEVSFTSQAQNDQLIAVVETGQLGVEANVGSLAARPGAIAKIKVTIRRGKAVKGAARVRLVLPDHIQGIEARPIIIPAGINNGVLEIQFGKGKLGPFNAPLVLRASVETAVGPVESECNLEVVMDEEQLKSE
jgi:hypothetical protein